MDTFIICLTALQLWVLFSWVLFDWGDRRINGRLTESLNKIHLVPAYIIKFVLFPFIYLVGFVWGLFK